MNTFNLELIRNAADEVLEQLYPALPLLSGNVLRLSNYGKGMYDTDIRWSEISAVANFVPMQDSPFTVSNYGTVNLLQTPIPRTQNIYVHGCKVSFNHLHFQRMMAMGMSEVIDAYKIQLEAKVRAWDELCAGMLLYGDTALGIPGLLNGSSIPTITSTLSYNSATPAQLLEEMMRLIAIPATASRNVFTPTLIGINQNLYNVLNKKTFNTVSSESVLSVLEKRLNQSAPYVNLGKTFSLSPVESFNADNLLTIMPDDANQIGGAVWELGEFLSPDNSESHNGQTTGLASAHEGATAGIVAKRPTSGTICIMTP